MHTGVKWKARSLRIKAFLFENTTLRQTVLKNTFWLAAGSLSGRVIRAFLIIYVARVLGAEGYGVFSYALALAGFFAVFADIGIGGILTREIARKSEVIPEYVSTAFSLKIGLLFVSNILIIGLAPFFTNIPGAIALLPLAALLMTCDGLRDFVMNIPRARERMQVEAGVNFATNLMITAFGALAAYLSPAPRTLLLSYALGSACGTLISFWVVRHEITWPWRRVKKSLAWPILKEAVPFGLMGILGILMLNIDTVMLGWLGNATSVGLYSAAQRPIQILYIIPSILTPALFPSFARFAIEQSDRFRHIFEQALSISLLAAIPIALGGAILAKPIMLLLYGNEYGPGSVAFALLCVSLIANFTGVFMGNAIFAHNKQKSFVGFMALGVVANLILNYLLIPRFGIAGSALATLLAQTLAHGLTWYKMRAVRYFTVLPHLRKIVLAALLMGFSAFLLDRVGIPVIPVILLSGGLYFVLLYVFREKLMDPVSRMLKLR